MTEENKDVIHELALFAGAGGGILGSRLIGFKTVCAVEIEPFCREVLLRRQAEGFLEAFPIWDDVRTFDGKPWRGVVDVITAGFPCQPFSVAGKRAGEMDERNMWPDTMRIIREVRPRFCLLENVPGLINSGYFDTILKDIHESGYDCRWKVISAAEVGAPHKRDRLWIVANAESRQSGQSSERQGRQDTGRGSQKVRPGISWWQIDPAELADTDSKRSQRRHSKILQECPSEWPAWQGGPSTWWLQDPAESQEVGFTESKLGRVAHGVAYRVGRLKAIGNGQVPAVAATAWSSMTHG